MSTRRSTRASAARKPAPIIDDSDDDENQTPQASPESNRDDEDDFTPAPEPEPVVKKTARRGRPRKNPAETTTPVASAPRRRTRTTPSVEPEQRRASASATPEPSTIRKRPSGRVPRISRISRMSSVASTTEEESRIEEEAQVHESRIQEESHVLEESNVENGSYMQDATHDNADSRSPDTSQLDETPRPQESSRSRNHLSSDPDSTETAPCDVPIPMETETHTPRRQPTASPRPSAAQVTPLADITVKAVNERVGPFETPRKTSIKPNTPARTPMDKPIDIDAVVRKRQAALQSTQEPVVPKNRLVITHLILTNFKSYAGQQVVGPFHPSFSSVVGPNGSGKSNVIDSLLFVFGFRASKMRQGKISALIHKSAGFPDLDYCEVEVRFQEVIDRTTGGCDVIPNSTLVVSRRAFKNNSSKYYINGRESTFTTVTSMLKGHGVDLDHKRFLILQGEVESIAQMKPMAPNEHEDGLLEYLEDIIGTSKYKPSIEESWSKLEALQEQVHEKETRVQHVEKEKSGLEEKKNAALAYIRDENELAQNKAALYQVLISDTDDRLQITQETVNQLGTQLQEELQKHQGNEEGIKAMEKQYKKGTKEYEQMEQNSQSVLKEIARIDKETVKFEEKKKFLANKQKKLEKTRETSKLSMSSAATLASQYADDIERYTNEVAELEQELKVEEKELEAVRANLAGKTQHLSEEVASKQSALEPWRAKVNDKQSAIAVAQSELDILREKENAGAKSIAELEAKITAYHESKETKQAELQELKAEKKKVEKETQRIRTQIAQLAEKEPLLKARLSGAAQKADEARASLSATQTQGAVLAGLMRMKESGRISGFHGRLGNLGAIDQEYDVAISTACPALNNMVVDTVEVGQQCIDHLRKNNLGRANFILLDRLAQRDLSPIQTPENAPRLFDLVKPKHDKFRPAFYSVLQNTLVAKDLNQANRIAYGAKRWRVVTLDGQLIDKSGTMSGGGTRVAKGGMSSKLTAEVSKNQVAKLEQDRDTLDQEYAELQGQQRELEVALRELNSQLPHFETKAQKITLELESFDRNIADCERRIAELSAEETSTRADKSRIATLEKTIATTEKEVSKLHAETAGAEAEIKALQDKIMEIGGVKLRIQKAKVDALRQQIDTITETKLTAEVSKSKEEKNYTKHEKALANADEELEKLSIEATKVEEKMHSHANDAAGIRQQAEEAQEELETRQEELQDLKKALDEKRAELNETRAIEIEMRNKYEEAQKSLNEYQRKQQHYHDKLNKLTYRSLGEFGGEGQESEGLQMYTKDELRDMDKGRLQEEVAELEQKIENTTVDLSVLDEYLKRAQEHAARTADLDATKSTATAENNHYKELVKLRLNEFTEGMDIINAKLKEMYRMITMGGNAALEYVEPFDDGVEFKVRPPRKGWRHISNLSGGEKTLSSLALVFALHHYKPTPLYVMDEIDAALDFRNVSIVANYIKERTKNAQFIVISLRNNMFELAARLIGVYKVNQMTKSVTLENKDYVKRDGQQQQQPQQQPQQYQS